MAHDDETRAPLKLDEVCRALRVSRGVATRLIRHGRLRAVKVGHEWRIPAAAVDALLTPPEAA